MICCIAQIATGYSGSGPMQSDQDAVIPLTFNTCGINKGYETSGLMNNPEDLDVRR